MWKLFYIDDAQTSAILYMPICKFGGYLTEGRSSTIRFYISDNNLWQNIWDGLHALTLKPCNYDTTYTITIDNNEYIMDTSLWPKLYNTLTQFYINLDTTR